MTTRSVNDRRHDPLTTYLQQQLDERGWTVSDLARRSGLSRQAISKLMHRRPGAPVRFRAPTEHTITAIARGLGGRSTERALRAAVAESMGLVDGDEPMVTSVHDLSDAQLVAELARRLGVIDGTSNGSENVPRSR